MSRPVSLKQTEAMAASNLIPSATMASLLRCLVHKGVLQPADIREVYETALMLLEQQQATVPSAEPAFRAAQSTIERQLA